MKPVIARNFRLLSPFPGQTREDQTQNYYLACWEAGVDLSQAVLADEDIAEVRRRYVRSQYEYGNKPKRDKHEVIREVPLDEAAHVVINEEEDENVEVERREVDRRVDEWMEGAPADVLQALVIYESMATRESPTAHGRISSREAWKVSRQATTGYRNKTVKEGYRLLAEQGEDAALAYAVQRWAAHIALRKARQQLKEQSHQLDLDLDS